MKCKSCNAKLVKGNKYCTECGHRINIVFSKIIVIYSIVALLVLLVSSIGLILYLQHYKKDSSPIKSLYNREDKVIYGYETIQILEARETDNDKNCEQKYAWSPEDKIKKQNNPDTPLIDNVFAIKIFFKNSIDNKNKIYYDPEQFYMIKKDSFDLNENTIVPGDEDKRITYFSQSGRCRNYLRGSFLKPGEQNSGMLYFSANKNDDITGYYLIAKVFDGSPRVVFDL